MKIVLNEDTKVGRRHELVEMNSLLAKLLIKRGKACLPHEKGCEAEQLLWAEIGMVEKVSNSFVNSAHRVVQYKARPLKKFGLFKYVCLTNNNNEVCVKHISSGLIYHLDSSKNRFSGIKLNDKVVMSNSIIKFLIKFPERSSSLGLTPHSYLTKEEIGQIENDLNEEYSKVHSNIKTNM